jgi:hypothetical protein
LHREEDEQRTHPAAAGSIMRLAAVFHADHDVKFMIDAG